MEKEKLIQNLREKIGENDFSVLSQRTIDNIVEPLLPIFADDDKVTDETYNFPINVLKSYIGQYRHDLAEGLVKGKATWENEQKSKTADAVKKALEEERLKNQPEEKEVKQPEDVNELIEAKFTTMLEKLTSGDGAIGKITNKLDTFINGFNEREKSAKISNLKESLKDYLLNTRQAEREPVVNLAIRELSIDEASDLDKLKIEAEKNYERLFKELYGDTSAVPFAGGAGGGNDKNSAFNAYIREQEAKAEAEAKNAEVIKGHLV